MGYFQWIDQRIKTFSVWDFSIFKICMFSFTLMIAKLWPPILSWSWKCYGTIFLVTYVYIVYKMFLKK